MVVLLSGGLDSATVAAWARARGFEVIGLSIDYGQRHRCELDAAKALASHLGLADHVVLRVDGLCPDPNRAGAGRMAAVPEPSLAPEIGRRHLSSYEGTIFP
jgi:7-cyano-7-deazaguanine synthase in queuosine biosynthesis